MLIAGRKFVKTKGVILVSTGRRRGSTMRDILINSRFSTGAAIMCTAHKAVRVHCSRKRGWVDQGTQEGRLLLQFLAHIHLEHTVVSHTAHTHIPTAHTAAHTAPPTSACINSYRAYSCSYAWRIRLLPHTASPTHGSYSCSAYSFSYTWRIQLSYTWRVQLLL